jgi:hypothetical protein
MNLILMNLILMKLILMYLMITTILITANINETDKSESLISAMNILIKYNYEVFTNEVKS